MNGRIISACAERSVLRGEVAVLLVDHLRVCGAVSATVASKALNRGSSPRVRSGRMPGHVPVMDHRIISACAERSVAVMVISRLSRDHLRVCGAVVSLMGGPWGIAGSSPRVRSGQLYFIGIWSGWMVRNV